MGDTPGFAEFRLDVKMLLFLPGTNEADAVWMCRKAFMLGNLL